MNKRIYILSLLLISVLVVTAQQSYLSQINVQNQTAERRSGNLNLNMDFDLSNLKINNQHMLVLTPILNSVDGITKMELPPVVVNGRTRAKALSRLMNVGNKNPFPIEPQSIVVRRNGTEQGVGYGLSVPLEDWMRRATLTLREEVTACCSGCEAITSTRLLSDRLLPADFVPSYQISYVTPEPEPVKQRSESHAARFTYRVGRAELLPDFGNNAAELAKVNNVIREIQNDKDLTITNLTISGYASPEGSQKSNMDLSQRRANTFADYLATQYGMSKNQFKINWYGEDWDGLQKAVEASNIADKDAILNIIGTVPNVDARDAGLRKLSGGQTYKTLLETYYPPLRRNEYTIDYVARAFDVNEAKAAITTRPQLLSLNEMFHVAQTYPKGSAQFKEVFDIAARMYPNDAVANLNAATAELEGGGFDAALTRLERFKEMPEAWNNLGIALVQKQRYEEALSYFDRAAARGDSTAKTNAEQLRLFLEDQK
ncbi:MAG: DUF3868 domain-containing protein [Bacteroidia bacterium]|nr:DUF3868 domain-containing protein [Bacteroidia bacterium]